MALPVLIVGAGPSGLALANVLAAYGVDFRIVDRKSGPVPESRANLVQVRTLELLDRLGLADRAVAQGIKITHVEVYERGRRAAEFPLAGQDAAARTPFPYALGIGQGAIEQLLVDGLVARGGAVEWDTELFELRSHDKGVTVVVKGPDGAPETISARWMVAADGASSPVRHLLRLGFTGSTYDSVGLLADVSLEAPPGTVLGTDRLRLHLTRGGFVGMIALGERRYRLFGAVPPFLAPPANRAGISHDAYAQVSLDAIQRWFDEFFMVDATLTSAEWTALFRIHSRITGRFRVGDVFLVGDAAHIHSPAGGQGMNLGIGDGINLGWKLALVATGQAHERLLDSYEAERYPVAKTVLRNADRGFAFEATNNPVAVWFRAHLGTRLIGPMMRLRPVRGLVFKLLAQTWISYRGSPAVDGRRRFSRQRLRPGDRVIDAAADPRGDGIGRHSLVLFNMTAEPGATAIRAEVEEILRRFMIEVDVQVRHSKVGKPPRRADRMPQVQLIRPDGHLAYAGPATDLDSLSSHLERMYIRAVLGH